MRESNFAFPAQNRACVCISSQLYDRRALDTTSPLPLFNSLTHLTYLTSTSPRIREIMTMDGGLERLVRILHDFCMCPPPPENPVYLYGLSPPNSRPGKLAPTLNPTSFDKHAAYRFSLAFQCVVNIGVRGSEPIRSRVVQAGTLDVVGCILEAWLANKGFAIGPSSSATGVPRESREQRIARRQAQQDHRAREEAEQLTRALQIQITTQNLGREFRPRGDNDDAVAEISVENVVLVESNAVVSVVSSTPGYVSSGPSSASSTSLDGDTVTSADTSYTTTPGGSSTPTGAVDVIGRDRSGTVIGRPAWDPPRTVSRHRTHRGRDRQITPGTDVSRPETETEDDGDVDMERSRDGDDTSVSPSPEPRVGRHSIQRGRRAVGITSDAVTRTTLDVNADAHIIISDAQGGVGGVVGGEGVGVEDGIVSLEPNDDFALGAPPGAPGAIDQTTLLPREIPAVDRRTRTTAPDVTPRAGTMNLPGTGSPGTTNRTTAAAVPIDISATPRNRGHIDATLGNVAAAAGGLGSLSRGSNHGNGHHHRDTDSGPYRDEDVLLSLQLLAYLSKYPHVRQAFYKPRMTFHPASANLANGRPPSNPPISSPRATTKDTLGFLKAFAPSAIPITRGKEKEKASVVSFIPTTVSPALQHPNSARQTNVFSLVERFTFRPSSTEADLPNPPPKLPPEIQYWAGVIMRNACRKDESRGGIRQCANMLCGKWESYPREFAKCRRCRKAKYCGKECQSTAWSEGHRFWCSAKDGEDDADHPPGERENTASTHSTVATDATEGSDNTSNVTGVVITAGGTVTDRTDRRVERERQRHALPERILTNPLVDGSDRGPEAQALSPQGDPSLSLPDSFSANTIATSDALVESGQNPVIGPADSPSRDSPPTHVPEGRRYNALSFSDMLAHRISRLERLAAARGETADLEDNSSAPSQHRPQSYDASGIAELRAWTPERSNGVESDASGETDGTGNDFGDGEQNMVLG